MLIMTKEYPSIAPLVKSRGECTDFAEAMCKFFRFATRQIGLP